MKIDFIGTGNMGCLDRINTSILVDDEILFDIGSGTVNQLRFLHKDIAKIKYIFISHFHADHFLDIAVFLLKRNIRTKNNQPLTIIGPLGIRDKVIELLSITHGDNKPNKYDDIESKFNLTFMELKDSKQPLSEYEVQAVTMQHGTCTPCNGYILFINSKKVGYTGDSTICDGLETLIKESTLIIMDVTMVETNELHIGYHDLINIANNNKEKHFYMVHRGDFEINTHLDNVFTPNDGDQITI